MRRRYKADTATARVTRRMPGPRRDWTREESGLFYGAEASVDDHECRRSAYKHTDAPRSGVRGWMLYMAAALTVPHMFMARM